MSLVARTEQAPMSYTATIQGDVNQIDPALPLYWVRSLADQYALDTWFYRVFGTLFVAFGLAALAMATIGLYGIMAFSARSRTREIGVRMALGASAGTVLRMMVRQGAWQVGAGLAAGLAVAALLARPRGVPVRGGAVGPADLRRGGRHAVARWPGGVRHSSAPGRPRRSGGSAALRLTADALRYD
ncbi:MAG: FtsX-like permease family protein [Vicinamibacterales bacterium]